MRTFFYFILLICAYSTAYAQNLTVKAVTPRPQDTRARTQPREDKNGNKCAIIRVGVVGVEDMVFPDAVGDVERVLSEYVVYVPSGLEELRYKTKAGERAIRFDDYGIDNIESQSSYDVIFDSENNLRSAIFSIEPQNAQLSFDGENEKINDGMAMINKPVGEYSYTVSADGFESQSGTVSLTEDAISTTTEIVLQEKLYPVMINVPENASVFIDNIPYTEEEIENLTLSVGKHFVRVTAENHKDAERTIDVKENLEPIDFILQENHKIVWHKEERTRTSVNTRNAHYITLGAGFAGASDMVNLFQSNNNAYDFNLEYSYVYHFAGMMAVRGGVGLGGVKSNKNEKYIELAYDKDMDSLCWMGRVELPLQIGMCLPLGVYNQHQLSIYGGGYARMTWCSAIKETDYKFPDDYVRSTDFPDNIWDYGVRLSAKLDLSHFTIGVDFSQSLNNMGFSAGLCIGFKIYKMPELQLPTSNDKTPSSNYYRAPSNNYRTPSSNTRASGNNTRASGNNTRTSGNNTRASGNNTRASGNNTRASGYNTRASGYNTRASGNNTKTSGNNTKTSGNNTRTAGRNTRSIGNRVYNIKK